MKTPTPGWMLGIASTLSWTFGCWTLGGASTLRRVKSKAPALHAKTPPSVHAAPSVSLLYSTLSHPAR
ncbi:MAG: hypothetical protein LBG47_05070 [Prevotellaceae bacterium]|nr:hypothetical protein [Prevotellaceae bacterium]